MRGRRIAYTAEEMAWLEANRLLPIADYHAGFAAAFNRDVGAKNLQGLRKRKGWKLGRTGHFARGSTPSNKGKLCAPGTGGRHPNAQKTQFQKGARTGRANLLYKPIGAERLTRDGYLERKIHDGLPMQSRWRAVHLVEWEAVNGPLPAGHCLKCLDGDKTNTAPANWELVSRGALARLNGGPHKRHLAYDEASPEVRPALIAIAKVADRARRLKRQDRGRAP